MTFLNIALLAGVAALAIPVIIHLFHKSRFVVVKWGAMHLLETVVRTNQRRIRLEQLILLIIRAAIPVLLALAMARPLWTGAQKLLGDARTSTVILLDNSYSMEASRAGLSTFALAKDEASRIISDLKRGSEVQVLLMGEGGATLLDAPTSDTARATQALRNLEAGFGAATAPAALDLAANIFSKMAEPARNLVMMTDFQRISFEATEDALLGQMLTRLKGMSVPASVTLFDVGQEVKDNVAVESLEFSRLMVGVGQKVQVRANLRNFGEAKYPDLRVRFRVNGREVSTSGVSLLPHEKGQVLFTHTFDKAGSHVIEVVAEADPLKADNSYLASIPVRDKLPVLLINGDPNSQPLKGETDYAEIALQPYSAGRVELADLIAPRVGKPEDLKPKDLEAVSVVVLANVRKLEDGQLKALEEFVRGGGGLMIFPGSRVETAWYNGALWKEGRGLLPLQYAALTGDPRETAPSISIVSQRFENPALELFNDPRNGSFSEAAIRAWMKMAETNSSGLEAPTALARLDSGDVFLAEKPFGDGRVISCATALDADWSNLPLRPFYLPLLQRLTVYLASTVHPPRNLEVGRPVAAFLPAADAGKKVTLKTPAGGAIELPAVKSGGRSVVEFGKTQQPGLYTLTLPDGSPVHYVVNASRRESDLQKLTPKEIDDLAKTHGVRVVRSGAEYQQQEYSRRYGMELWKPLLWALLGLCFAELILQQRFARAKGRA